MMGSLTPFLGQQPATAEEAEQTRAAIDRLSEPTSPSWLQGRIAVLLSHYFVASTDARLLEAIAEDWHDTLIRHPAWAIRNACLWWISAENPRHRSKPTPGEIEARVLLETQPLRAARIHLRRGIAAPVAQQVAREVIPQQTMDERRAAAQRIMASTFGAPDAAGQAAE